MKWTAALVAIVLWSGSAGASCLTDSILDHDLDRYQSCLRTEQRIEALEQQQRAILAEQQAVRERDCDRAAAQAYTAGRDFPLMRCLTWRQ